MSRHSDRDTPSFLKRDTRPRHSQGQGDYVSRPAKGPVLPTPLSSGDTLLPLPGNEGDRNARASGCGSGEYIHLFCVRMPLSLTHSTSESVMSYE